MYKILLGLPIGLADYQEIFPMSARNLFRLRDYSAEEIESLDLTFEVTFSDPFGTRYTKDLIPGGSNLVVDGDNRELYIDKYARFFLWDGMSKQLAAFKGGFSNVVDGNAFSLFSPEEIQLLLCGSEESKFDVDVLQSVTNYSGWASKEEATESSTVKWFWEYVSGLTYKQQKNYFLSRGQIECQPQGYRISPSRSAALRQSAGTATGFRWPTHVLTNWHCTIILARKIG
ncbi:hypothetical protein CJJ09_003831 [Candidozyma auris]|nr:hypothetical protein CJJ09_003831 [[Candida] auris]